MFSSSSSTATIVRNPQGVAGASGESSDSKSVITSHREPTHSLKHSSKKPGRGRSIRRWLGRLGATLLCRARPDSTSLPTPDDGPCATTPSEPPRLTLSIPARSALSLPLSTPTILQESRCPDDERAHSESPGPAASPCSPVRTSTPIRILPPELLIEIFAFTLFSPIEPTNTARRTRTTPLTLSEVCSEWRTLVLETRTLWSWVFARVGEPPDLDSEPADSSHKGKGSEKGKGKSKYPKLVHAIQDWIERTNPEQPLTIQMYFEDEESWKDRQPPEELLMVLMNHRERWRSIDFTLPEACYEDMELTFPDATTIDPNTGEPWTPYPLLESISLQPLLSDARRSQSERKTLDVFKNIVPKLTHLRLNGYYVDDCHFPWAQLRSLALQHVYVDECFYVLSQTPLLEECVLSTMLKNDCNRPIARAKKAINLPVLRVLKMQSSAEMGSEQAVLFQNLTLPVLRELIASSPDVHLTFPDLHLLVARSGCEGTLKTLEVGGANERCCRADDAEKGFEKRVIELLEGLPGLREVRIRPESGELKEMFLGALCRGVAGHDLEARVVDERPTREGIPFPTGALPFTDSAASSPSSPWAQAPMTSPTMSPPKETMSESPDPLLPNLRYLEYDGDGTFDEGALMKMVRLRCPTQSHEPSLDGQSGAVRRLKGLKFCVRRTYSEECQAVLDEAGLS